VRVRFRVARRVAFGESVAVVGAAPELGAWDVASAPRLRWCEGDEWRAVVDFKCGGSGASRPTGAHNDDAAAADDADDVDDDLPPGLLPPATEFKFVVVRGGSGAAAWESGDNRVLDVAGLFPGPGMAVDVAVSSEEGGRAAEAVASVVPLSALDGDAAAATPARAPKQKSRKAGDKQQQRQQQQQQHQSTPAPPVPSITTNDSNSDSVDAEGRAGVGAAGWLGRDVAFMTSNDHSRERPSAATWEVPPGLPQSHPARQLIEGDRDAASWLAKLRVAQRVLVDDAPRQRPRLAAIAHAYAYLQWVATGAIPCAEGGGHFRPNHHARAAQAVFRSLEWALEEDAAEAAQRARREQAGGAAAAAAAADGRVDDGDSDQDDDESCVLPPRLRTILARRLSTKLPSFGEQFTQSVPLTRIRDIAHRGDIPHALKQEIKHTLQNKLHRNAGPEDLVAAEAMLERLESGNERYPDAFMAEFRTFVAELREFFGAASLAALLRDGVRPSLAVGAAAAAAASADEGEGEEEEDDEGSSSSSGSAGDSVRALDHFLARKSALDAKPNHEQASLDDLVGVAHALVTVRAVLLGGLASGMRNDAPDAAAATRQRWRLAEARSEDYLFVLLARVVGGMMAAGGAASSSSSGDSAADDAARFLAAADVLAKGSDRAWAAPLGAAVLGLRSLALSGWQPAECAAVERELAAWQDAGGVADDRDGAARRLRASLDRAQRVCAAHADALLAVLPGAASRMGPPLGVPEHAVATFAEAEVRASVAFQLSRLLALLQRAARVAAARAGGGGGGGIAVSEWEPIVAGTARGVLVDVPSMDSDAARRALADAAAQGQGVVLLLREATGDEELGGGGGGGGGAASPLRGIALAQPLPHLSHLGVRARQERVPLATISPEALAREVLPLVGAPVELRVGGDGSTVELVRAAAGAAGAAAAAAGGRAAAGAAAAPKAAAAAAAADAAKAAAAAPLVKPAAPAPAADCSQALEVVPLPDARAETCGAKAASCARLLRLSQAAAGGGRGGGATAPPLFLAPRGAVLPFGAMEAAADAAGVRAEYDALLDRADALSADGGSGGSGEALAELDAACDELGRLVSSLRPPSAALERVLAAFPQEGGAQAPSSPQFLIARSSANVEDLAGLSGAGLYDSVPNVPLRSAVAASSSAAAADLGAAVAAVWASLHTRRAVLARRAAGVPQRSAAMAVLVQEQLAPDVSFVLHTRSPVVVAAGGGGGGNGASSSLALAELAPGLGETLAGASRGSGWRLLLDKGKGELAATLAFANFSEALVPPAPPSGSVGGGIGVGGGGGRGPLIAEALYARAGGRISGDVVEVPVAAPAAAAAAAAPAPPPQKGRTYPLARRRVDYARQRLSASADARGALGAELARVCAALEAEFGGEAQDAEGCVVGFNGAAGGGAGHHQVYVVQSRPQPRED
jgi:phosphoglucan,water dikinase